MIAPSLPRFTARYPDVRAHLTLRDQHVDPVAEGLDLLVRVGQLGDSILVASRLGASRIVHRAAPSYEGLTGLPRSGKAAKSLSRPSTGATAWRGSSPASNVQEQKTAPWQGSPATSETARGARMMRIPHRLGDVRPGVRSSAPMHLGRGAGPHRAPSPR
ncbi:LysR substrate-binding domain-containing protein [Sorangium cellulosum]|uniref:LysR substrate-binding domain-containing protein n=1 Tax=Sorangium cellulosum TaxID=56 RepID=UPI003D9A4C84